MERIKEVCRGALEEAGYHIEDGVECENALDLKVIDRDGTTFTVSVLRDDKEA